MSFTINLTANGVNHKDEIDTRVLLVDYLREKLELTGTHVGVTSSCGACTIHIDGKAIKSCTMFAVQLMAQTYNYEGMCRMVNYILFKRVLKKSMTSVWVCTPGMIMTAADLLKNNSDPL